MLQTATGNNTYGYSNAEYDALIDEARTNVTDLDARWASLLAAEKILMEDAGIAPLYQRSYAVLQKPYVADLGEHLVGADYSYKWASNSGTQNVD